MYHFDIPKTRQYDNGKIEVVARSSVGEALATTELKVVQRKDDYRGVLKNSPRRKYKPIAFFTYQTTTTTSKEQLTKNNCHRFFLPILNNSHHRKQSKLTSCALYIYINQTHATHISSYSEIHFTFLPNVIESSVLLQLHKMR